MTVGEDAADANAGDGRCRSTLPSGACTLRAAIEESNALAGENTVRLGPRTHRLTLPDRLWATDRLRVRGVNTTQTVIDGMERERRNGVFALTGDVAWLSNLTITRGWSPDGPGGAILIQSATVSLANVVIRNNFADGAGGIWVGSGSLILIDTSVSDNTAMSVWAAGIVVMADATLTMDRSTIDGNEGEGAGAITNYGAIRVSNSTISGNSARGGEGPDGFFPTGGIFNSGTAHLNNVTIYGNSVNPSEPQGTAGLFVADGARTTLSNTIIAGNTRGGASSDCKGPVTSYGYNLIQNAGECTLTDILAGNITGRDPQLLPLAFNFGAATRSHLPASSSQAISAGHPQVGPGVSTLGRCEARDQAGRMRQLTGSGRRCDIGSIEGR